VKDFASLTGRFELDLPDPLDSAKAPTAEIIARYSASIATGDPYLESLLFDYANYLFVSSSRPGSLPPNLQGRWSENVTDHGPQTTMQTLTSNEPLDGGPNWPHRSSVTAMGLYGR
jgi:hypothetical protein